MTYLFFHRARGISLIEVIVSIAILGMITGGIIAFERSVIMNTKVVQSGLIAQQQIRKAQNTFVSDVRSAIAAGDGSYAIASSSTSTLIFYANIDGVADVERIRYFLATSTLWRGVLKPTATTTYNVANEKTSAIVRDIANATSSAIFTYYDRGYDGFTSSSTDPLPAPVDISAIRLVKMSLTVNPNGVRAPVMQTYTTQAMFRNLKDNL